MQAQEETACIFGHAPRVPLHLWTIVSKDMDTSPKDLDTLIEVVLSVKHQANSSCTIGQSDCSIHQVVFYKYLADQAVGPAQGSSCSQGRMVSWRSGI